jgi:hypothetical protein
MLVLERMLGSSLDPSAENFIGTKVGFDCTRKGVFPPRNAILPEIMEKMSPARYLDAPGSFIGTESKTKKNE